jgi:hypothetical protein
MFPPLPNQGPFCLDDEPAYRRWRDEKLAQHPRGLRDLLVPVADPLEVAPARLPRRAFGPSSASLGCAAWTTTSRPRRTG